MINIPEPSLIPPEPRPCGVCACCGEDIFPGEAIYTGDGGEFHSECIAEYISDHFSPQDIADALGYDKKIAKEY